MKFAEMFSEILKFLRRFFNEPIDCPWCFNRLDEELGVFERVSPVAVTMAHAPECFRYFGNLRRSSKEVVWHLHLYVPAHLYVPTHSKKAEYLPENVLYWAA